MENFSNQIENIASTFGTDTIFILGKGPSIDRIDPSVFANALVIGINDAERIVPVDITIFHDNWVVRSIEQNRCRSLLYVTSQAFRPERGQVAVAPYVPISEAQSDIMMQRLLVENPGADFVIEDVLFLSALRICRIVAQMRGRPQNVYMVGFDFTPDLGYAHAIDQDFAPSDRELKAARIAPQEFYFINTLYMLRNSPLAVCHVGDRVFSALSPEELNSQFSSKTTTTGVPAQSKVQVVAELTTNHFGDRHRLERMVRAAKAAGADLIKVQKRDVDTFYARAQLDSPYVSPFGKTFRDYRMGLELSRDDFQALDALCRSLGIGWFASILDEPSFRFIQQFEPSLVKLPSTISQHTEYLKQVADNYDRGVVLSTGMTDRDYEDWVLKTFTHCDRLYLMQANSAYPTPIADCNIGVIRHYRDLANSDPRIVPAYSSHDFGAQASALAVGAGARMVEKHVKLGNTEWAHFDAVALDLTTSQFKDYVTTIREAELIIGVEEKRVNQSENHKYARPAPARPVHPRLIA